MTKAPLKNKRRDYIRVIAEVCSPDDWREIVEKAVQDAKEGEPRARAWLTSILVEKQGKESIDAWAVQDPEAYDEYEALPSHEKMMRMAKY